MKGVSLEETNLYFMYSFLTYQKKKFKRFYNSIFEIFLIELTKSYINAKINQKLTLELFIIKIIAKKIVQVNKKIILLMKNKKIIV